MDHKLKFKINMANIHQRAVGVEVSISEFLKLERAAGLSWAFVEEKENLRQTSAQICAEDLELLLTEMVNNRTDDDFMSRNRDFMAKIPEEANAFIGKCIGKILANMARDYAVAVYGKTDESQEEWDEFREAFDAGKVGLEEIVVM